MYFKRESIPHTPVAPLDTILENYISRPRFGRYMHYARHDRSLAFLSRKTQNIISQARNKVSVALPAGGWNVDADKVIAELSFGFWVHLVTSRYRSTIWGTVSAPGSFVVNYFPNIPTLNPFEDLQRESETIRDFRNRIAHLEPIFAAGPQAMAAKVIKVIRWMDNDVADYVNLIQDVSKVINSRPR